MNKSKILKKSLAMLLAIMMIVAAIPMSAAAAGTNVVTTVKVMPYQDSPGTSSPDTWSPNITLTKSGDTFTGNIPDTLTRFTLQVGTNTTASGNLYFADEAGAAGEKRTFFWNATTGVYTSQNNSGTEEHFDSSKLPSYESADGKTVTIKLYAEDSSGSINEYTVILTRVTVDPTSGTQVKSFKLQRQIGASEIDNVNRTITVTVPAGERTEFPAGTKYFMKDNYLTEITLSSGAKAYVYDYNVTDANVVPALSGLGGLAFDPTDHISRQLIVTGNRLPETAGVLNASGGDNYGFTVTDNSDSSNKIQNWIKVVNSGETDYYQLIINTVSGLDMFSFEGALENFVDAKSDTIYVRFPYNYIENKTTSGKVNLKVNFQTQFPGVTVKDKDDNVLTSGTSVVKDINSLPAVSRTAPGTVPVSTAGAGLVYNMCVVSYASPVLNYHGSATELGQAQEMVYDVYKPLLDQQEDLQTNINTSTGAATEIKVEYTSYEGALNTKTYKVVLLEPALDNEAILTSFSIGSETAIVDQANKTIDITLPKSYESRIGSLSQSEVTFEGSPNAVVVSGADVLDATDGWFYPSNMFGQTGDDGFGSAGDYNASLATHPNGMPPWTSLFTHPVDFSELTGIRIEVYDELEANLFAGDTSAVEEAVGNVVGNGAFNAGAFKNATIYTLNINFTDATTTNPAITSMTLEDPDGNQYRATIDQTTKNIAFTDLPYKIKWDDGDFKLEGWKLYYSKAPGTSVLFPADDTVHGNRGAVGSPIDQYLTSPGVFPPSGSTMSLSAGATTARSILTASDIWPDTRNGSSQGRAFRVQSMDYVPGTSGQGIRYMYTITMNCQAAKQGSNIISFAATDAKDGDPDNITDSNVYTAAVNTVAAPAIGSIKVHLSYYTKGDVGPDGAAGGTDDPLQNLYPIIELDEGAVMFITVKSNTGAFGDTNTTRGLAAATDEFDLYKVYSCEDANDVSDIVKSAFSLDQCGPGEPDALRVYVMNEEYAERWLSSIDHFSGDAGGTDNALQAGLGSETSGGTLPSVIEPGTLSANVLDADTAQYKIYDLTYDVESPKTDHSLTEVSLVDKNGDEVEGSTFTITGSTISGTVPYCVAKPLADDPFYVGPYYLKYKASKNAIVGVDSTMTGGIYTGVEFYSGGQDIYTGTQNVAASTDIPAVSFDGIDAPQEDDRGNPTERSRGNAALWLKAGASGKNVDVYYLATGTPMTAFPTLSTLSSDKIQVLAEDNIGKTVYDFSLKYADANTAADIEKFTINGVDGVISGTNITVTLPYGSEKTSLKAEWELSDFARATVADYGKVTSGKTEINYTNPVTFNVTAENGTQKRYVVTVNVRTDFTDVFPTDWFYDEVMEAAKLGYVYGYEDGSFRPNNNITRGEFTAMLARAMAADLEPYKGISAFPDVASDAYYAASIAWAADNDIISGFDDGEYKADQQITREQMAVIISRSKGLHPILAPQSRFADDSKIADWSKPYVYACKEADIVVGYDDNNYGPQDNTLRCQAAAVFVRSYKK